MEKKELWKLSGVILGKQTGSFSFYVVENDYRFEWIAPRGNIFAGININRLVIRLSEIAKIETIEKSINEIKLIFGFNRGEISFKIPFTKKCFVDHLNDFLDYQGFLQRESVIYSNKGGGKIVEQDSSLFLSSEQYISLGFNERLVKLLLSNSFACEDQLLTLNECKAFFDKQGKCSDFTGLKQAVFRRGLTPESRALVWPLLLGYRLPTLSTAENLKREKEKAEEYRIYRKQWEAISEFQTASVQGIAELKRVIDNDVKRLDRRRESFKGDNNPNLKLAAHVLTAHAIYNRDTGYVQGIGDFASPIIELLIQSWQDSEHAILFDGKVVDMEIAESVVFWMMEGLLETTQQDRMFTELEPHERFAMERVFEMATIMNKALKKWLSRHQMNELIFLYRPFLLLFKREFENSVVLRLWDSFFAAERPYCMTRLFLAAILTLIFPQLLVYTNGGLEEVMSMSDKLMPELDALKALNLAIGLEERMKQQGLADSRAFDPLPENSKYRDLRNSRLVLLLDA